MNLYAIPGIVSILLIFPKKNRTSTKSRFVCVPTTEQLKPTKPKYDLKTSTCYLIKEEKPSQSYEIFTDLVTHEVHGLLFTRTHPQQIREKCGLVKTPIIWMGENSPAEDISTVSDLEEMTYIIAKFVSESENSVILIDNIGYLANQFDFRKVLKAMYYLKEVIIKKNSRLLIPVDTRTFEDREIALLEGEMETIS